MNLCLVPKASSDCKDTASGGRDTMASVNHGGASPETDADVSHQIQSWVQQDLCCRQVNGGMETRLCIMVPSKPGAPKML